MLRALLLAVLVLAGCHHDSDPSPMHPKEGELPPLPPSSGTPVGYLIDNAGPLQLRADQLSKLQEIDKSLATRDDEIDTQLRIIEKPEQDPEAPKGAPPPRHNNAPGAQVHTTADAAKLHSMRKDNDSEAISKAFAVLDPGQQTTARKLLEDRGVNAPGTKPQRQQRTSDDGTPLQP